MSSLEESGQPGCPGPSVPGRGRTSPDAALSPFRSTPTYLTDSAVVDIGGITDPAWLAIFVLCPLALLSVEGPQTPW